LTLCAHLEFDHHNAAPAPQRQAYLATVQTNGREILMEFHPVRLTEAVINVSGLSKVAVVEQSRHARQPYFDRTPPVS
jgi:hypothetical protein